MATIALIGPDGAGKTAIARRLEARQPLPLRYLYMGVNADSGNVTLPTTRLLHRLRGRAARAACREPGAMDGAPRADRPKSGAARRRRGPLWMAARLMHHLAEEWYRQLACWRCEFTGKLVVCDRHFVFDYAPEIVSEGGGFDRTVRSWIFTHLYPAPDLAILLDAPGEVLFERKGESTIPELERRRCAYVRMGEQFGRFVRVDATLPIDEVYEQVAAHILRFRAARARERPLSAAVRSLPAWTARTLRALRMRVGSIRTRFICKALDAVLTADLPAARQNTPDPLLGVRRRESKYERMRDLVRATAAAVPGASGTITRFLLETAALPFAGKVELLGFGSGSTVFRLCHDGRAIPRVLKVYRRSLGQRPDGLRLLAHDFRSKYTTILRWYEGADFILPAQFIILQSPLRGYSAVACVQRYIPDAGEDFLDRPDEEVLALLRASGRLRRQFRQFAECTLRAVEHEQRCPDLLGYGNLTLSRGEDGVSGDASSRPRLWLLDFGIFDLGPGTATLAATRRRLTVLLERIRRLNAAASSFPPVGAGGNERAGRQGGAREVVGASGSP